MVGWLVREDRRGRRPVLERTQLAGMTVLRAGVPAPDALAQRTLERRLERAAELLCRAGVRRVLAQEGFAGWPLLEAAGLQRVSAAALCQALAAPLALAALKRQGIAPGQAAVSLAGTRVNRPLFQAAEQLCRHVRTLIVDAPAGGRELAGYLRCAYGAPVVEPEAGVTPHAVLCFAPAADVRGALKLFGAVPDLGALALGPPPGLECRTAEGLPLLALLWEEGRLDLANIQILEAN